MEGGRAYSGSKQAFLRFYVLVGVESRVLDHPGSHDTEHAGSGRLPG